MGRKLKNQAGQSLVHPLGFRIFSPDDWIVRIELVDGGMQVKGCPPELPEQEALARGVRASMLVPSQIKRVDISRRRNYLKVQA